MTKLRAGWIALQQSLWFVPTLLVSIAVLAALGLVELQTLVDVDFSRRWPRLLGAGAEGARGMLGAIATSMVTVAGVVFSITIVALSLATSQYSPRVLRNFMSDRPTQFVLGAFVAVFAYCLVVMRTIRGADEGAFVPSLAVLGGVALAFVAVGMLIYFIHHLALSIQVTTIVMRIVDDTTTSIDRLFPDHLTSHGSCTSRASPAPRATCCSWSPVRAPRTGYITGADVESLGAWAHKHDRIVYLARGVGTFVAEGETLLRVGPAGGTVKLDAARLRGMVTIRSERDVHQDPSYGIQQLVDIALKALSPSVHDPTTASTCIDHLGVLVVRLADRSIGDGQHYCKGRLRVIEPTPDFASIVQLAFGTVTHHAGTHTEVYQRIVEALARIASGTRLEERRQVLVRQLDRVLERANQADLAAPVRDALLRRGRELRGQVASPPASSQPSPLSGGVRTNHPSGVASDP